MLPLINYYKICNFKCQKYPCTRKKVLELFFFFFILTFSLWARKTRNLQKGEPGLGSHVLLPCCLVCTGLVAVSEVSAQPRQLCRRLQCPLAAVVWPEGVMLWSQPAELLARCALQRLEIMLSWITAALAGPVCGTWQI